MAPEYYLALTTGLFGGFGHCIGMCGPLVASYSLKDLSATSGTGYSPWLSHLFYNAGRISAYMLIGAVMGLTGSFVNVAGKLAGLQNLVAVAAGIAMVAFGLSIAGLWRGTMTLESRNSTVLRFVHRMLTSTSRLRTYLLGMALGFLPCGLSYTIFIAAAGTGSAAAGMMTALCFGIGTVPALLSFGAIISELNTGLRIWVYRLGGVMVIIMGALFIFRGLRDYAHL
ncbi:MAG: sulfite exporter TauE/SafE family protein [Nitrospirota bacterium]